MNKILIAAALAAFTVAGCSRDDQTTTSSTQPDPNPQVEADPTPQTGSGGQMPSTNTGTRLPSQPAQ